MEKFTIPVCGENVDVVRGWKYSVTYTGLSEEITTPMTVSGVLTERKSSDGVIVIQTDVQDMWIHIDHILSIKPEE